MKILLILTCFSFALNESNAQIQIGSDILGEAVSDWSGYSVCMPDANTLAIGAPYNIGNGAEAGHVRIYSWNGSIWQQKGNDIEAESEYDISGYSLSMPDANTIAIGAPTNVGNGNYEGHVRIYSWNGTSWLQKGTDINGELNNDFSGKSVSMPDANTVAIGASSNIGSGAYEGHVRIYSWNGSTWLQKGSDINGESANDASGHAVSMPDANTIAIGAPFNDGNGNASGHVRIYSWNGSTWLQKGFDIDGEAANDQSGYSLCMSDANTIVIGAPYNDITGVNEGHVRIYSWNGSSWLQKGNDIDGIADYDQSGWSVSMPDASTVGFGAIGNDANGSNAGKVKMYSWNGSTWLQKGNDINGSIAGDNSGWSVSMPDNNTIAIGAHLNDGNGYEAGQTRVFSMCVTEGIDAQSACNSFTWIDGITYTTSNNTATHVLTNVAGCDSVVTLNLTINNVNVGVTNNSPTLVANQSGANYQWINCSDNSQIIGANSESFTATENGSYAVIISINGCTDTSVCEVIQNVSLNELENDNFKIYPNPFSTSVNIVFDNEQVETKITILDMTGKKLKFLNFSGQQVVIENENWDLGVYYIQIQDQHNKIQTKKIILF